MAHEPKLYRELASWWPLLSSPEEYAEDAERYRRLLIEACDRPSTTVLELGSGGGNNASHLKRHFGMTLVDRSPDMLAVSRGLNPECEHIEAEMRTVRLGRVFDAVFVHDAVAYLTTEDDVRGVIETAFAHTRPGGAALFCPDYVSETFRPSTGHGGHDGDGRALRYLEWITDPDPSETEYAMDLVYLLRRKDGSLTVEHDRHVCGLFGRGDWVRWLADAGFRPEVIAAEHGAGADSELFLGVRPGNA